MLEIIVQIVGDLNLDFAILLKMGLHCKKFKVWLKKESAKQKAARGAAKKTVAQATQ